MSLVFFFYKFKKKKHKKATDTESRAFIFGLIHVDAIDNQKVQCTFYST